MPNTRTLSSKPMIKEIFSALKDVARVEFGALGYTADIYHDWDIRRLRMAVIQTSGSNARQVIIDVKKVNRRSGKNHSRPGVKIVTLVDNNVYLNSSIHKVCRDTPFEAFLLVCLVVFYFPSEFPGDIDTVNFRSRIDYRDRSFS